MIVFEPVPVVHIGALHLSTHGLLMAAGFLVVLVLLRREAKRKGMPVDVVDGAAIAGVLFGIIGARIAFIATASEPLSFLQMLKVWEGGLSSHGGYVLGALASMLYLKWKKVSVLAYVDLIAPYVLVGWAIGRIGCLLNWDSYGSVPLGACPQCLVVYGVPHHPTQLYESLGYLIGFAIVMFSSKCMKIKGSRAALALLLFASTRLVVDFFRADPFSYLVFSRVVTGVLILFSLIVLIRDFISARFTKML